MEKRSTTKKEPGLISLETMIRGVCEKRKLLDLLENFTIYNEAKGEVTKLVAKNHQFLGVNNAIAAVDRIRDNNGKLGVFWHTQGSGKSYSMVFFSQKVLRKIPGDWTFLIVTDRIDLDGQIYRNFANTGAVIEDEKRVRAESGEGLKRMLNQENHRYVFTLIQKFATDHGERYPVLSTRSDIIVITDEAHRSQYDIFAANMRSALPNAAFIGFTGTPLMAGEEPHPRSLRRIRFRLQLQRIGGRRQHRPALLRKPASRKSNSSMTTSMKRWRPSLKPRNSDDDQQAKLARNFKQECQLLTREERLERIGEDIVAHFMGRGVLAKAMVISIDNATAVRTFDKVRKHWQAGIANLRRTHRCRPHGQAGTGTPPPVFVEETDMAVVVSQSPEARSKNSERKVSISPRTQAHGEGRPRNQIQGAGRSPPHRLRLRHVDHGFRRAFLFHDLPR